MFIENLTNEVLTYRAHGNVIELKPGLNTVEDALVNIHEIARHFGQFINIYATNVTMLTKPQEVKDEETIIEGNNLDTANTDNTDGESSEEQEPNEPANEPAGEEQGMVCSADGCAFNQTSGEGKTETSENASTKEEEKGDEEEKEGEEQDGQKEESREDEKPALEDLKRDQLVALAEQLNLEFKGNISNVNLIKLIKEAQK